MKNSIKISVLTLSLAALFTVKSSAQSTENGTLSGSGIRYSVGVETGIPVGNLNGSYKWNLGGSIQADIPVLENRLYATINAGYNNIFAESDDMVKVNDIHLIPVKAGLKYFFIPNVYVQGEAGVVFINNKSYLGDNKSAAFVYAPQAGVLFPVGDKSFIDAGIRYEGNSKFRNNGSSNNFLGLRVAYAFNL